MHFYLATYDISDTNSTEETFDAGKFLQKNKKNKKNIRNIPYR